MRRGETTACPCASKRFGSGNASLTLAVSGASVAGPTQDFKKQVIHQIVRDRFFDGDGGEFGALYHNNGSIFAGYQNDPAPPNKLFHHYPTISNYNDPFQFQYYTLDDLADLNQENSQVDAYFEAVASAVHAARD